MTSLSDTDDLPSDKPDIPKGRKQPKRRQHSAMNETDSCTPKKPRLETVDVLSKPLAHPSNWQFCLYIIYNTGEHIDKWEWQHSFEKGK